MRAKRLSNDFTGTTKPRRMPRAKLEALGREWGTLHGMQAIPIGNLTHDRACALAVKERTGRYPNWDVHRLKELGIEVKRA